MSKCPKVDHIWLDFHMISTESDEIRKSFSQPFSNELGEKLSASNQM